MSSQDQVKYVPAGTGPMYCGLGDRVTFLATGAETHGSCFIVEATAFPGGGPPPHLHQFEDESFYILEGAITLHAGDRTIHAKPGDFVHIPRGTVHSFKNEGKANGRMLVVVSPAGPAGSQQFFEESFFPVTDLQAGPPPVTEESMKRIMASAAKNGLKIVAPSPR